MVEFLHTGWYGQKALALTCFIRSITVRAQKVHRLVSVLDPDKPAEFCYYDQIPSNTFMSGSFPGYVPVMMRMLDPLIAPDGEVVLADDRITEDKKKWTLEVLEEIKEKLLFELAAAGFEAEEEFTLEDEDEFTPSWVHDVLPRGITLGMRDLEALQFSFLDRVEDPFRIEQRRLAVREVAKCFDEINRLCLQGDDVQFVQYTTDWNKLLRAEDREEEFRKQYTCLEGSGMLLATDKLVARAEEDAEKVIAAGLLKRLAEALEIVAELMNPNYLVAHLDDIEELFGLL